MSDTSFPGSNQFPEARDTVPIQEESLVVEIRTDYQGKTNMYVVERTSLILILDKSGREVQAQWQDNWTEVAPGIETRREDKVFRSRIGSRS